MVVDRHSETISLSGNFTVDSCCLAQATLPMLAVLAAVVAASLSLACPAAGVPLASNCSSYLSCAAATVAPGCGWCWRSTLTTAVIVGGRPGNIAGPTDGQICSDWTGALVSRVVAGKARAEDETLFFFSHFSNFFFSLISRSFSLAGMPTPRGLQCAARLLGNVLLDYSCVLFFVMRSDLSWFLFSPSEHLGNVLWLVRR